MIKPKPRRPRKRRLLKKLHLGPWQEWVQEVAFPLPRTLNSEQALDEFEDALLTLHDQQKIYVGAMFTTYNKDDNRWFCQVHIEQSSRNGCPDLRGQRGYLSAFLRDAGIDGFEWEEVPRDAWWDGV